MAEVVELVPQSNHILMNAACSGNAEVVLQMLMSASTLEQDKNGYTALHYAAVNGHTRLVQSIVSRGFKVDAKDNLGYTALHLAASHGHIDVVQVLIQVSRSINSQDRVHGNTPVHEAAWNGFSQTMHELVTSKANVNAINHAGFSALHLAAQNGHNESSRILLFAGCSPDHKNSYGDTPLHTAARYGHAGVTQILISAKCAVNETNKNGDTALHIAAAQKQKKISKLLLDAGIDVLIANNQNETALDIARRKDFEDLVVLISKVQVSVPRRLSKTGGNDSSKIIPTATEKKQKWTSIFKKNKSKDKLPAVPTIAESVSICNDDCPPPSLDPTRAGAVLRDFQNYQMLKQQHRTHGHDVSYTSMAMVPPSDCAPDGSKRGVLSRYTPMQGIQFYRDLAGNIRQGPVGYVASMGAPEPPVQYVPSEPVYNHPALGPQFQPSSSFRAGYSTLHPDYARQRDHLSYLRSRHAGAGYVGPAAFPTSRGHQHAFIPTYMDQSGRPWPAMYPTMYAAHPAAFSNQPGCQNGLEQDARSEMSIPVDGVKPMYRSRSDETLSTVSSRPSFRRHHARHPEKKLHRKAVGKTQHHCRAIIETRPSFGEVAALRDGDDNVAEVSPGIELPGRDVVGPGLLPKCTNADSSSNPDSGYSGTSTSAAPPRPPSAPRSESSSLRSGSSGDVIGGGNAPTIGSSCRSDSIVSICNSL